MVFFLFNLIFSIVLELVDRLAGTTYQGSGLISGVYALAVLIPGIAVTVRRLHDIGKTGWWLLLVFIPLIGLIVLIIFACIDSDSGNNKYGPNPKIDAEQ